MSSNTYVAEFLFFFSLLKKLPIASPRKKKFTPVEKKKEGRKASVVPLVSFFLLGSLGPGDVVPGDADDSLNVNVASLLIVNRFRPLESYR